jgi:outer membrane protein assembly factor BamB
MRRNRFPRLSPAFVRSFLVLGVLAGMLVLFAPGAAGQEAPSLFIDGGEAEPGARETVVRKRVATLDFSALQSIVESGAGSLRFNLFEDVAVVAQTKRIKRWSASQYTWFGQKEESLNPIPMEIDVHSQTAFATLRVAGRPYRIQHLQGSQYEILELDLSGLRDEPSDDEGGGEHEPQPIGIGDPDAKSATDAEGAPNLRPVPKFDVSASGVDAATKAWKNGSDVIDVLVLYTEQARDSTGGATTMEAAIRNAFNNANTSFQNSGVNARLRMAASRLVTYPESNPNSLNAILNDLTREANTNGDVVNRLRKNYGADIVGLVVGDAKGFCGMANLMDTVSSGHRDQAYFVVGWGSCLGSNFSFAHEIGHVMGARHDRYVDDTDGSPFDYNHGYVNITGGSSGRIGWRTIMAYDDECEDARSADSRCRRINWWSDPDDTRGGDAMGIASGSNAADNVRALNNTAPTVAQFESPSPIVSGTVTDLITGTGLADVEVTGPLGPITDASGEYDLFVHWGTVQLRPSKGDYEFTPGPAVTLRNITSNRTQDFDAGIYHELSGSVYVGSTRQLLSNVKLKGAPGAPPPPTPNVGSYSFEVLQGWSGTITPQSEKYTFSPSSKTYGGVTGDVQQDFVASVKTYTISGTVEDASGTPIPDVTMQGLPRDPQTDALGRYSITLDYGWSGTVTPKKDGYNFQPASRSYATLKSDHTDDYTGTKSALADSKWPLFGRDARHASVLTRETVPQNLKWSAPLGNDAGTPVLGSGGNVYVGSADGSLYAFDATGSKLWKTKSVPGDSIHAAPAAASGYRFYVPQDGGTMASYDRSGALTWSIYLDGELHASPVVGSDGVIYVGSDSDSLYAVNPDGSRRWGFGTGGNVRTAPAIGPSGTLYVGSDDGYLYALRPDGTQKWRFQTGDKVRSSPAVDASGTVYVGSDDGKVYAVDSTGTQVWSVSTGGNVRSSPAIGPTGRIYVGSSDDSVYAITPSGQTAWTYATNGPVTSSPAVSFDANDTSPQRPEEIVYVGADRSIYALDARASSASNRLEWRYRTQGAVTSSPALGEKGLYVGSNDHRLYHLGAASGGGGTSRIQVVAAGMIPTPEEIYVIGRLAEEAGAFGEPGWAEPGGCEGGPLLIPACGGPGARFGGATGFRDIIAGESLRFGALAPWVVDEPEALDRILTGESREGLLGDFVRQLNPEQDHLAVVSGFSNPEDYPDNPNGRSTGLNLFVKEGARAESTDPEQVQVLAGHFVPDAPEMKITLENSVQGTEETLGTLKYGEFGEYSTHPAGRYTVTLTPTRGDRPKREGSTRLTVPLDLTGQAGETVSLLATGSYEVPDEPPLAVRAVHSNGAMKNLGSEEGALAPGVSSIPGLFEEDLLVDPGERQPVVFEPRVRLDGLSGTPRDALQLLPTVSSVAGFVTEEVAAPVPEPFEIPAATISFLDDRERVDFVGQPLRAMPELLEAALEERELEATHLGRMELGRPDGTYQFWMALRAENGYAVPVASLLQADVSLDADAVAEAVLTSYTPAGIELDPRPEPGQPFKVAFRVRTQVRPLGGEFQPISEVPIVVGAAGEVDRLEHVAIGQIDGKPARIEAPLLLRVEDLVLGPEGESSPLPSRSYVALRRGEERHELAAMWASSVEDGSPPVIERGQVHTVGRRDALEVSAAATIETDRRVDFGATGVDIAFEATEGVGSVTVEKYGDAPTGLEGIAGANVSDYRFVVRMDGTLTLGSGTEIRLDVGSLDGVREPRTVTLYRRSTVGEGPFTALPTTYVAETNELVAPTDRFSEFVLASDSSPLPVELSGFEARENADRVVLSWSTASETNNAGFEVQRKRPGTTQWNQVGFVEGAGTTSEPRSYQFADANVPFAADSLLYRLRQVDLDGTASLSDPITLRRRIPPSVQLLGTYPNPARHQATVRFALPRRQAVSMQVYDVLGRRVATMRTGTVEAGRHQLQVDVSSLSSGMYFLRLKAETGTETRKMTVVR